MYAHFEVIYWWISVPKEKRMAVSEILVIAASSDALAEFTWKKFPSLSAICAPLDFILFFQAPHTQLAGTQELQYLRTTIQSWFQISNHNFFPPHLHILLDLCHKSVRFVFQTIALLNIYRNPQNSAQSADGLHCKFSLHMQDPAALTALNFLYHTSPHWNWLRPSLAQCSNMQTRLLWLFPFFPI